jgi:tetratricopeptide (TPR) repeat protein
MRFSAFLEPFVRRAHDHFVAGDTRAALAALEATVEAARRAGDVPGELGARLALLQARGDADGAEATLAPLEALAESARDHGLDDLYALVVLERAERLRGAGQLGDAAHHAQVMIEWGERTARPALVGAAALALGLALRAGGRLEDANGAFNGGLWAVGPLAQQPAEPRDPLYPALPQSRQTVVALLVQHAQTSLELGQVARARESVDALAALPLDVGLRAVVTGLGVELARVEGRRPALDGLRALIAELLEPPTTTARISHVCRLALIDGDPAFAIGVLDELAARAPGDAAAAEVMLARASVWFRAGQLDEASAALATMPPDGALAVDQLLLTAALALALGTPRQAIEPALMAAALAESREQAAHTAAAWHLAAGVYRRVGMVGKARAAREQAAAFYRRTGLRARLAALEIERGWEALIEGRDDDAAEVLTPLAGVSDPEVAAQAALALAALAARRGRPGDALPALLAAHDRLIDHGAQITAVPLARAARLLTESAGRTLPASVNATLVWAAERHFADVDALFIPSTYTSDDESINTPN